MPKVIARIFGGLGNQLFIYATARALAQRTGAELVLDTHSGFQRDSYERQFSLQRFNVQYREANAMERFGFPLGRGFRYLLRNANRRLPAQRRFYITDFFDANKAYLPEITTRKPAPLTWLEGYWQSPRYFKDIRKTLQHELQVSGPLSTKTVSLAQTIREENAVCIHFRMLRHIIKGGKTGVDHKPEATYFRKCIHFMAQKLDNPLFVCFSDDPQSVKSYLSDSDNFLFVTHNKGDEKAIEDFYLMAQCRHFILSNSTFGWWPAWLNNNRDKIVITPEVNYWDNQDILPDKWLRYDQIVPLVHSEKE
jgi:hypothetical protein